MKKITKIISVILLAFTLSIVSDLVIPNSSNSVSAATTTTKPISNCKNPYKNSSTLSKYNPCVIHTTKSYISITSFAAGAGAHYTAGAGLTHTIVNKGLTALGKKTVPGAMISWSLDTTNYVGNQIYLSAKKKNIKGWNTTHTWQYKINPLSDGGGIPKKYVTKVSYTPVYK